jgi:hypothetical protein
MQTLVVFCGMCSILSAFISGTIPPRPPYIDKLMIDLRTCLEDLQRDLGARISMLVSDQPEPPEPPKTETIQ